MGRLGRQQISLATFLLCVTSVAVVLGFGRAVWNDGLRWIELFPVYLIVMLILAMGGGALVAYISKDSSPDLAFKQGCGFAVLVAFCGFIALTIYWFSAALRAL